MGVRETVKDVWQRLAGVDAAEGDATMGDRKTKMLPSILTPYRGARSGQEALAQADAGESAENLPRRRWCAARSTW